MVKKNRLSCLVSASDSVHISSAATLTVIKRLESSSLGYQCPDIMEDDLGWSSEEDEESVFVAHTSANQFHTKVASSVNLTLGRPSQTMKFYPSYLLNKKAEATFSLPRTHYPLRRKSTHRKKRKPKNRRSKSDIQQPRVQQPHQEAPLPTQQNEKKTRLQSLNKSLDSCMDIVGVNTSLANMVRDWWGKDSPKPQRRRTGTVQQPHHDLTDGPPVSPPVFCDEPDCTLAGCHGGSVDALDKPTRISELKKFGRLTKGYSWCDVYSTTGTGVTVV